MQELHDEPIAAHTTMRVGGPAARMVVVETSDELVDAVREVDDADEPLLVLAGGSNLVVADAGFAGTVVKVATRGVHVDSEDLCGGANVTVAAGEDWDGLVARAVEQGWSGIEALSGIPGSTGATPVQNVGAYGQEVAQTIARVRVWDRVEQQVRTMMPLDCRFTYRHSMFKDSDRYVVLDVMFQLVLADAVAAGALRRPRDAARSRRRGARAAGGGARGGPRPAAAARDGPRRRGPRHVELRLVLHQPDPAGGRLRGARAAGGRPAGCRRPVPPRFADGDGNVKTSAAWLIERAGFGKGFGMPGPAALSTKHTLAVTNRGDATASEIADLARTVRDGVRDAFGVPSSTSRSSSATVSDLTRRGGRGGCTAARTSPGRRFRPAGLGVPPPRGRVGDLLGDVVRREATAAAADTRDRAPPAARRWGAPAGAAVAHR